MNLIDKVNYAVKLLERTENERERLLEEIQPKSPCSTDSESIDTNEDEEEKHWTIGDEYRLDNDLVLLLLSNNTLSTDCFIEQSFLCTIVEFKLCPRDLLSYSLFQYIEDGVQQEEKFRHFRQIYPYFYETIEILRYCDEDNNNNNNKERLPTIFEEESNMKQYNYKSIYSINLDDHEEDEEMKFQIDLFSLCDSDPEQEIIIQLWSHSHNINKDFSYDDILFQPSEIPFVSFKTHKDLPRFHNQDVEHFLLVQFSVCVAELIEIREHFFVFQNFQEEDEYFDQQQFVKEEEEDDNDESMSIEEKQRLRLINFFFQQVEIKLYENKREALLKQQSRELEKAIETFYDRTAGKICETIIRM